MVKYARLNFKDPRVRQQYIEYIEQERGFLDVIHYNVTPIRTHRHNRFYRVLLKLISYECGHTPAELHGFFKIKFGKNVKWTPGSSSSTADMTTSEFQDYIEEIYRWYIDFFGKDIDVEEYP